MNDTWSKLLSFTMGLAIGSVVTWKYIKTKYERIAQEEIDSVKETFLGRNKDVTEEVPEDSSNDIREYANKLKDMKYVNYSNPDKDEKEEVKEVKENKPYVISPEEFEDGDYPCHSLTYYADGVVTFLDGDIIDDAKLNELIGSDSLNTFGQYEDDSVYVRNDIRKIDYEILRDYRNYAEVR